MFYMQLSGTIFCCFITAGLIFAMVKRRQGAGSYLLFWKNPHRSTLQKKLAPGFPNGKTAEASRILFCSAVTLISLLALIQ